MGQANEMMKRDELNLEELNIAWYEACADAYATDALTHDMSWPYRDFLSHLSAPFDGKRVLDLGCGSGRDLAHFRKRGLDAEGIDACEAFCVKARELSGAKVRKMKFSELNLERDSYEGIFANGVLMHVEPHQRAKFVQHLALSLKANGVLYVHYPRGEGLQLCEDGREIYLTDTWRGLFIDAGFHVKLDEGRPVCLPKAEQTWQAMLFIKN